MNKINDYNLFAEKACELLLNTYTINDFNLSWNEFLDKAVKEFKKEIEKWKKENV